MDNNTQEKHPLIYQRIAAIMAEVPAIKKTKSNGDLPYKFRGIDEVYNTLHPLFVQYQVFTTSEILNFKREVWTNEKGKLMIEYALQVKYRFTAIDGSYLETQAMGQAMDSSDKASNKAMSMSHKTAILQIFMIPTLDSDDPDATSPEPQSRGYQQQPPPQYQHHNGNGLPARQQQEQRPPAQAHQEQRPAAQAHQNGYRRDGQQQSNDRPASSKSLQYLRDLAGRQKVSQAESNQIDGYIRNGLTADQCSALIDALNAFLQGQTPSIFQPVQQEQTEQYPVYQEPPQYTNYDDGAPF